VVAPCTLLTRELLPFSEIMTPQRPARYNYAPILPAGRVVEWTEVIMFAAVDPSLITDRSSIVSGPGRAIDPLCVSVCFYDN